MKDIAIFGVGGFGREVLTLVHDINKVESTYNFIGFFDDGHERGEMVNGYPVLGKTEDLNRWPTELCLAIAIGNPQVKHQIIDRITNPKLSFPTLIHPAVIIGDQSFVKIGNGCVICAGCILTTNIKIGDFIILNLACTVGHDCVIGDYVSVMPSVNISGEVIMEEEVYVGTGAKLINQISVGRASKIGAGAVVINSLPENCTAVGVPAVVIK